MSLAALIVVGFAIGIAFLSRDNAHLGASLRGAGITPSGGNPSLNFSKAIKEAKALIRHSPADNKQNQLDLLKLLKSGYKEIPRSRLL